MDCEQILRGLDKHTHSQGVIWSPVWNARERSGQSGSLPRARSTEMTEAKDADWFRSIGTQECTPTKFRLGARCGEHTSGGAAFFLQVYDSKCIALITCQKWTF